ncbi:MAG: tyrosine-protein phosphatase [Clostridia bacterium]|nr:tyrosine-protein phosphatase [Clostridia bacterium]
MKKCAVSLMLILSLLAVCLAPCAAEAPGDVTATVSDIQKYGNVVLSLGCKDLMDAGYAYGDVITVTVGGTGYDMPIGSNYADVDQGSMICRAVYSESEGTDYVLVAINMGDFATAAGIASKTKIEEDPGYVWTYLMELPVTVTVSMKEKGGYYDEYVMRQLSRSLERNDYPDLTDSEFANFRPVTTTGMGRGVLYRSSSPVNPEINRNAQAAAAAEAAGIRTVMNLADAESALVNYEGYEGSWYSTLNVIPLNLGVDFTADDFRAGLAEGFRFIASHEGPYLVHCNEGKDRAGFASAILECLMGATAEEVVADYMVTYYNYYGVADGTDQYNTIASSNIVKSLSTAFGVNDLYSADLAKDAEKYLASVGMTADEIAALKAVLGPDAAVEEATVTGRVTEIEKYGHALLDISIADFASAGFELGDVVTVEAGGASYDMPFFNGYYVDRGEMMLRAYPGHEYIAVCINYGKFAETAGIGVGDEVTISLKEKAGALTTQEVNSLVYTDARADYASDEVFANFRPVALGDIAEGRLYRSASPVNNEHGRAAYACTLMVNARVKTVLNLAETPEELEALFAAEGFASAGYKALHDEGHVLALGLPINYTSDEFGGEVARGLTFLSGQEVPYLVHCTEGKDRAGFVCMLLEALMGADKDGIVADYMESYVNYYHIDPEQDAAKYEMIAEKNVCQMLCAVCGLEAGTDLAGVDLALAARDYLTAHGMAGKALDALTAKLK